MVSAMVCVAARSVGHRETTSHMARNMARGLGLFRDLWDCIEPDKRGMEDPQGL
jgi:hypothetical protein